MVTQHGSHLAAHPQRLRQQGEENRFMVHHQCEEKLHLLPCLLTTPSPRIPRKSASSALAKHGGLPVQRSPSFYRHYIFFSMQTHTHTPHLHYTLALNTHTHSTYALDYTHTPDTLHIHSTTHTQHTLQTHKLPIYPTVHIHRYTSSPYIELITADLHVCFRAEL